MTSITTTAAHTAPNEKTGSASAASAGVALAALAVITLLALSGAVQPTLADKVTLLFLAIAAAISLATPLRAVLDNNADAATFALGAGFFIIYSLARRAGPDEGLALPTHLLKDAPAVVPWSAFIVAGGLVLALLLSRPRVSGPIKGLLAAIVAIAVIGCFIFKFLQHFYPVSVVSIINPELIVYTAMQSAEYAALGLLCNAVCSHAPTRRLALRALPVVLLLIWARHQFSPAAVEDDE